MPFRSFLNNHIRMFFRSCNETVNTVTIICKLFLHRINCPDVVVRWQQTEEPTQMQSHFFFVIVKRERTDVAIPYTATDELKLNAHRKKKNSIKTETNK